MMGNSCAVDVYINFKANNVLNFTSILLNDLVPNKVSLKYFNRFINTYFVEHIIGDKTVDVMLEEDEKSETIEKEFKTLNVTDEKLKAIYIIFFRKSLISGTISGSEKAKEMYRLITSAIYIALELDSYIVPSDTLDKPDYESVIKKVIASSKKIMDETLKKSIMNCETVLKKDFDNAVNVNYKFLKKFNSSDVFNVELVMFKPCVRTNNEELFYSRFNYILDKLDNENPKEVDKMLGKKDIINGFSEIELEIVSFIVMKNALIGQKQRVYVDLPDEYLSKMTNINSLFKLISSVKTRLFLNIRYDQLIKYNNTVRDLNSEGYSVVVTKGDADIDPKKLYGTKGCFIPYDSSVTFLKNLTNAKLGRVEVIVIGAKGKKETQICYDKKVDYIVNI